MRFATAFRHLRIHTKLTQKDVAKFCGHSSAQAISNIEKGLSYMPKRHLVKLCKKYSWGYPQLAALIVKEKYEKLQDEWLNPNV